MQPGPLNFRKTQMKKLMLAYAIALTLASTAALAHDDEHHGVEQHKGHAAALGQPGDPNTVSRTIEVEMSDTMRFSPSNIAVQRGEPIKIVVKNTGQVKHEMVLGSIKELKEHAALMRKFPNMEHTDPNMVVVQPGKRGELVWQFTKAGTVDFACLQPGHFEAGMVGKVVVRR